MHLCVCHFTRCDKCYGLQCVECFLDFHYQSAIKIMETEKTENARMIHNS